MNNIAEFEANSENFQYSAQNPSLDPTQDPQFYVGDFPSNISGAPDSLSQISDTVSQPHERVPFDPNLVADLRRKTAPPLRCKACEVTFHDIVMTQGLFSGSHQDSPVLTPRTDDSSPHSRKSDSGKKRGKYKIYTDDDKGTILAHVNRPTFVNLIDVSVWY